MKATPEPQRRYLGCGYLPPPPGHVRLTVWQPPVSDSYKGQKPPELTVCAGYTANLPEVVEASIARARAKLNMFAASCADEQATDELMDSVLVLDAEYSAVEGWLMTPSKDGGGGA